MLRKLENKNMGKSNLGWLNSTFHFSFAEYFNVDNMNFGALRVINDDLIAGNTGFDPHPHRDNEGHSNPSARTLQGGAAPSPSRRNGENCRPCRRYPSRSSASGWYRIALQNPCRRNRPEPPLPP